MIGCFKTKKWVLLEVSGSFKPFVGGVGGRAGTHSFTVFHIMVPKVTKMCCKKLPLCLQGIYTQSGPDVSS